MIIIAIGSSEDALFSNDNALSLSVTGTSGFETPLSDQYTMTTLETVSGSNQVTFMAGTVSNGGTLVINGNAHTVSSFPGTSGFITRLDNNKTTFAGASTSSSSVQISGVCAGPDYNDSKVYVYAVGTVYYPATFGTVTAGVSGQTLAFIWKLTTDLETVSVKCSETTATPLSCSVLQHSDATDSGNAVIFGGYFSTSTFTWPSATSLSGYSSSSGFLVANPFGTSPRVLGFNGAKVFSTKAAATTDLKGVLTATFSGSFTDDLGTHNNTNGYETTESIVAIQFSSTTSSLSLESPRCVIEPNSGSNVLATPVAQLIGSNILFSGIYSTSATIGGVTCTSTGQGGFIGSYNTGTTTWNWVKCLSTFSQSGVIPINLLYLSSTNFIAAGPFATPSTTLYDTKLWSEGNDDLYIMIGKLSDGSCNEIISWGKSAADSSMGITLVSNNNVYIAVSSGSVQYLTHFEVVECDQGAVLSSGHQCLCTNGYVGDSCDIVCPGGASNPCSDHGSCFLNGSVSACRCEEGYYGDSCSQECPTSSGQVCNGLGVCGTDGLCYCAEGYTGTSCTEQTVILTSSAINIKHANYVLLFAIAVLKMFL